MQPPSAMEAAASILREVFSVASVPRKRFLSAILLLEVFPAALLLCLALSGCNNSCYSGFWNPNGSGVAVSNTSCPLTKATGTVAVQMSAASVPSAPSAALPSPLASPRDIQHIFVTLRGIDAHPNIVADDAASSWQELAPELVGHPVQLDLLAANGDSRSSGSSASANAPATVPTTVQATVVATVPAIVPADEYHQLRLRLVPLHLSTGDVLPENNACGNVGWNCIVFVDGSVRPLEFDGATPEIHINMANGSDKFFHVLPDEVIHLSIEFDAASSMIFSSNSASSTASDTVSNAAVHLVPVFKVVSRSSPPSAGAQ